jgi:hypothetical protein
MPRLLLTLTSRIGRLYRMVLAALAVAVATPHAAQAHSVGQSYIFLRVYEDSLVVTLELTTPDLNRRLNLGWNLSSVTRQDVEQNLAAIRAYVEPRFALRTADGELRPQYRSFDMLYLEVTNFILMRYVVTGTRGIPAALTSRFDALFDLDPKHRNFFIIEHNWKTGTFNSEAIVGVFTPEQPTITIDLSKSAAWRGFVAMIKQGIWHIWIGADHILFLVALALPAVLLRTGGRWEPVPRFREALRAIVVIVSCFTLAHTVTLSLAALNIVALPSRLIESVIAGSIIAAAAANLMPRLRVREAALAFAFGLFHGFGFATVLGDLGLGREHMALSLLGFNIGVELGQLAIICAVFPVLFLLRKTTPYRWALAGGSVGLIALSSIWLYERVLDVNVPILAIAKRITGME